MSPAETAYEEAHYSRAEDLFTQELATKPGDPALTSKLVAAEVRLGETALAISHVDKLLAAQPDSAAGLTSRAEIAVRRGEPWKAMETLDEAVKADPCWAREHLIRSRILRMQSMYAEERVELDKAYSIDPNDSDIKHAWLGVVQPAQEIKGVADGLATMKDLDADTRKKAEDRMHDMMSLLSENSGTCKVLPAQASAVLPLQRIESDPMHIQGYRLEVKFPQTTTGLQIDTASSGMYISKALADKNGLQPQAGDPQGTVHVDHVQIGPLEFHDCIVGVTEAGFPDGSEGFIGTDMFAQYLITLNQPAEKMVLDPLPSETELLPGDRSKIAEAPEFAGYTPVYHKQQYLLVPVMLNQKMQRLFVLDTGIRFSTMTAEVAHGISTTKIGFTNPAKTPSGSTLQIYRDRFAFRYANLEVSDGGVLEYDPAAIDQNTGMDVAGMLGFDMLHSMVLHLDYRDGLVKLEAPNADVFGSKNKGTMTASAGSGADACRPLSSSAVGVNSTMAVSVPLLMDAGHMKPGKEFYVKVVNGWKDPECTLGDGDFIYGKVMEAGKSSSGKVQLSLKFESADCKGHAKRPLGLRLIGAVGQADFEGMMDAMPSEVKGGGRSVGQTVASMNYLDLNLNPGGMPHTVHPGIVLRIPKLQIGVGEGPSCSDRLTTTDSILRLAPGTVFLLAREYTP
ncbi:hypothetical protein ACFPT7_09380 [Acidicapsa dinghuensis]|uniref:Tetratricopeptide repeat protein n=1 Tax=Acidicapsa dinghuensis TaxID=2218256 RepID=A0ABW1EEU8_9BACT|nr:hypothetical protein [Acidicapsa dinghuensis]